MSPPPTQYVFPPSSAAILAPYLPPPLPTSTSTPTTPQNETPPPRPFVTLTYTTSLDSAIALTPGAPTALSGPQSMAMTHFLRSRHAAILIGSGTLLADNPSLNCRLLVPDTTTTTALDQDNETNMEMGSGSGSGMKKHMIRPVVVDARARWDIDPHASKVLHLAATGESLAPFIVSRRSTTTTTTTTTTTWYDPANVAALETLGGKIILVDDGRPPGARFAWRDVFAALSREGLASIMVEGGASVINALLGPEGGECVVDSVVVTLAPRWLGEGSLFVRPERVEEHHGRPVPAAALRDVTWLPLGQDVVLCGKPVKKE